MNTIKHLLLVDDESNITRSIKRLCRPFGYHLEIASSAMEALNMMMQNPAQVILSDQMMPEMTGSQLFSKVHEIYPNTVKILLTGHTALDGLTKAVNEGHVFKILFKPWDDEHLIQTLEEAFEYFHMKELNRQLTEELRDLNQNLEQRVDEKTRELNLHVRRLQVSQNLFEHFPEVAMGVSNEMFIIQANRKSREVFGSRALVGMNTQSVFPEALQRLMEDAPDSDGARAQISIDKHLRKH